tara:strand:- start:1874 stop:2110 length:237 start_codon:yes stop_codon:yes gene_type:complete
LQPVPRQQNKNNLRAGCGLPGTKYKITLIFFFVKFFLHQNSIYLWQAVATWQAYQLKIKISCLQQQEKEKTKTKIIII